MVYDPNSDTLYVTGGLIVEYDSDSNDTINNSIDRDDWKVSSATLAFDFATLTWSRLSDMSRARYGHSCAVLPNTYLVVFDGKQRTDDDTGWDDLSSGSLNSIEQLCVSGECDDTDNDDNERTSTTTQEWSDVDSDLDPARTWSSAVTINCPYSNDDSDGDDNDDDNNSESEDDESTSSNLGCSIPSDAAALITGGVNSDADVKDWATVFSYEDEDDNDDESAADSDDDNSSDNEKVVRLSDQPCMDQRRAAHSTVYVRSLSLSHSLALFPQILCKCVLSVCLTGS